MIAAGPLEKMRLTEEAGRVRAELRAGDAFLPLAGRLGATVEIRFDGVIRCMACGRVTRKSYAGGHCYPCSRRLARCDLCVLKPETCHYDKGTCREPDWAQHHCMVDHIVYVANTTGPKVGITRATQVPTRWFDQGACQALPLFRVATRHMSGLVEDLLRQQISDRTDWRALVSGDALVVDLEKVAEGLLRDRAADLEAMARGRPEGGLQRLRGETVRRIRYEVDRYPPVVRRLSLDETPRIAGRLIGIKGQYLLFEEGVFNVRRHRGYEVELRVDGPGPGPSSGGAPPSTDARS